MNNSKIVKLIITLGRCGEGHQDVGRGGQRDVGRGAPGCGEGHQDVGRGCMTNL